MTTAASHAEHHSRCPVCDGGLAAWRRKDQDGITYEIDRCQGCGYAFVNPRPSLAFLIDHYRESGHHAPDVVTLDDVLEKERTYPNSSLDGARIARRTRELLGTTGRALDVGCGYGFLSQAAQREGFDVTAIELAETERSIATEMLGRCPVAQPFEEFVAEEGSFDVVFMSQILEHALDVNEWADKARRLLRSGGVLAVALPNFGSLFRLLLQEAEPYICPPDHLNFFDTVSLRRLLVRHGFIVRKVEHVSRLPRSTFEQRLGSGRASTIANWIAPHVLGLFDRLELGQILNLYAEKR